VTAEEDPVGTAARATGIRHDLRHGLATLQALLAAATDDADLPPEQVHSLLSTATGELHYALRLVDALPSPAEGAAAPDATEAGDGASRDARCDVQAAVTAAVRASRASRRSFRVEIPDPLEVAISPTALARVLRNLLGNAVAATPPGGVVLIRAFPVAEESGSAPRYVCLEIHDDGPGPGGAGFTRIGGRGLDVVRSIVLPSGGWLVLGRSPTGGARAAVTLPRV
jgi:signal transduction histidine kinase